MQFTMLYFLKKEKNIGFRGEFASANRVIPPRLLPAAESTPPFQGGECLNTICLLLWVGNSEKGIGNME
jgi:hypothetical protein